MLSHRHFCISRKFNYDSKPIFVQPQPGQVVWGHAFYIRPEAVNGGTAMTWEQCLRDAAIVSALGFNDRSNRLLEQAISKGPDALAQRVRGETGTPEPVSD